MKFIVLLGWLFFSSKLYADPLLSVKTTDEGGVRWLYFSVEKMDAVYGFDLEVQYDRQVLRPVDTDVQRSGIQVLSGQIFVGGGHEIVNYADLHSGKVRLAAAMLYPASPISGSETIGVLGFRHIENKVAKLSVEKLQLGNMQGRLAEIRYEQPILVEPAKSVPPVDRHISQGVLPESMDHKELPNNLPINRALILMLLLVICLLLVLLIKRPIKTA